MLGLFQLRYWFLRQGVICKMPELSLCSRHSVLKQGGIFRKVLSGENWKGVILTHGGMQSRARMLLISSLQTSFSMPVWFNQRKLECSLHYISPSQTYLRFSIHLQNNLQNIFSILFWKLKHEHPKIKDFTEALILQHFTTFPLTHGLTAS